MRICIETTKDTPPTIGDLKDLTEALHPLIIRFPFIKDITLEQDNENNHKIYK